MDNPLDLCTNRELQQQNQEAHKFKLSSTIMKLVIIVTN